MLQQFFSKLGARYVVITDIDGYCMLLYIRDRRRILTCIADEGVVDKKTWLAFLSDLEERS